MIFLGGPSQVGKTTLSKVFISKFAKNQLAYLNWDNPSDKARIKSGNWPVDEKDLRRWHKERSGRIVKFDVRDLENVKDISEIELLIDALPERVGSPFGAPKIRAVKKEQKVYLWDWSEHADQGKKWENFVGSHLLKYCHFLEDTEGHKMDLRFPCFIKFTRGVESKKSLTEFIFYHSTNSAISAIWYSSVNVALN